MHAAPLLLMLLATAAELHGQTCRGGFPFAASKAQGQARYEGGPHSDYFAVSGGFGGDRYYGLGTLGVRKYDNLSGQTIHIGFGAGRILEHRYTPGFKHCLEVRVLFGTGPDNIGPMQTDQSSSSLVFGIVSGRPLSAPEAAVQFTPFGGLSASWDGVVTRTGEDQESSTDFYELVTLGLGVSFSGGFAIQPYAHLPLGRDSNKPVLGMSFALKLGSR